MINLFSSPSVVAPEKLTKEQSLQMTRLLVEAMTRACAKNLLRTYTTLRTRVSASEDYTAEEFYAAIGEDDSLKLKSFAVLAKTILNAVAPGTVSDDVPELVLSQPKE